MMAGKDTDTESSVTDRHENDAEIEVHKSFFQRIIETVVGNKLQLVSAIVVIAIILTGIFAPWVAPYDPDKTYQPLQEPNSHSNVFDDGEQVDVWHPLGTDSFGHDVLSRIIFGTRISLLVAFSTVIIAFSIGTTIGLVAGYKGGRIDDLLMRYIDFQWAFPELVLAIAVIAFIGGLGVMNVIIAISLAYVDDFARLVRGETLWIREEEYIKAAKVLGMTDGRIMSREILPNAVAPIIVQATIMIPLAILAEASLSFLGLGVSPATPTWGLLISEGRSHILSGWWISVMPGIAIVLTVLSFNILGDGLRDSFDITEVKEK